MPRPRDPYATPRAPRERTGPLLRFVIVAVLLGVAAWGYMAYSRSPELTEARTNAPAPVEYSDATSDAPAAENDAASAETPPPG